MNKTFDRFLVLLGVIGVLVVIVAIVAMAAAPPGLANPPVVDVGNGITVSETGTTDTFTVKLEKNPNKKGATVTVTSGDTSEVTISPGTLTFTGAGKGNWATPQTVTVTGVDDDVTDGTTTTTITVTNTSSGSSTTVTASNTDSEVAAITVGAVSGSTTEAGGTATFTAVLDNKPTANVTVTVTPSDTTEATASGSLTFTDANWNAAQTVTLTGVDDDVDDGTVNYTVNLEASGGGYAGVTKQVSGSTTDDDTAGITVTPTTGLATSEAGATATFTVVLASEPTADVTIAVSSSDTTEAIVDKATLAFTADNWNTAQIVTVTGVDDGIDDGDVGFTIVLDAATSTDTTYDGIDPTDVSGTNTDTTCIGIDPTDVSGTDNDNDDAASAEVVLTEFTDLDGLSDETVDAIKAMVALGICEGTSETTFSPQMVVSRWQMALFVSRQLTAHGLTLPDPVDQGFEDLDGLTQQMQDAISQIAMLDVTTGTTDTTYAPAMKVTRAQMALFMTRVLTAVGVELPAGDGSEFDDIAGLEPATQVAIRRLAELDVVFGKGDGCFAPNEPLERWQMALFIVRTLGAAGVPTA
ncbi:MAG: S-layer homology domain-containing protein [Acidimicrobiia bacterium]